ncbi:MAG: heme ABC transporter permease, partial [Gammaproteobacteria bacterium]
MMKFLHRLGSPACFYRFAGRLLPFLAVSLVVLLALGLYGGLVWAPPDYQQGEAYRIIFVHVPAAWMSLMVYGTMAALAFCGVVWNFKMSAVLASASAPIGASFTFIALATGGIWGKPMWGTWWVWDARLTSELVLLFLYLGFMALQATLPDKRAAWRAGAILLLVGFVNVPVVHFSVDWWNTLHQPATVFRADGPAMHPQMLYPLLTMAAAFMV